MNETILVVDDEVAICQSLKAILEDEGYQVLVTGSGEEAVNIVAEEMPQLVLLDIWLPGMDGLDTLKTIHAAHPNVLVIMMSGHGNIETAVKATKLGAFDFIEKPLSLDKVIILVNNALNVVRLEEENIRLKQKVSHQYELT
ncbi:MAG: sigma-54-dependent Fis family transcriptional regulator, partial [Smithella sp.]|nr:sigma-54-dependent Fis family transcriptional regulator [Smithella sp.]